MSWGWNYTVDADCPNCGRELTLRCSIEKAQPDIGRNVGIDYIERIGPLTGKWSVLDSCLCGFDLYNLSDEILERFTLSQEPEYD